MAVCMLLCCAALVLSAVLTGCTTSGTPILGGVGGGGGTNPTYHSLTGNWVLQITPTAGGSQFTQLAGFINEATSASGGKYSTTAAFQDQPSSSCYTGADFIPLYGNVTGTATLFLYSFDVEGQFVTINATGDATLTHMTGTYSIGGGCADGASGTLTGTRYAVLKGTYSGALTGNSGESVQLTVAQNTAGTGRGNFFVSGSAVFQGFSCFTSGTMAASAGSIVGNAVQLAFTANDGSTVTFSGTIDPTASTMTITSTQVQGGSCAGSLGGATLTLQ